MALMTSTLACLTADVPGTGGVIKQREDDFLVEEQPLYEPCGQGEHLYLYIEKRGQTTIDVLRRLAKMFKVRRGDIGYAGLKDKRAVTRQHFSIHLPDPSNDEKYQSRIQFTPMTLLWSARHTNKLRRGHLRGNRFVIYIRQVDPSAVVRASEVIQRLSATGVPNFIGEQRFGYRQNNHLIGRLLLLGQYQQMLDEMLGGPLETDPLPTRTGRQAYDRGDYAAALECWPRQLRHDRQALDALRQGKNCQEAVNAIDPQQRQFVVNSLQSAIFNEVLDRRIRGAAVSEFGKLVAGDLAWKHDSRAVFAVDEATAALENAPGGRVQRLEVSPSGPMWGHEMTRPTGVVAQWERDVLESYDLGDSDFAASPYGIEGRRRPMRVQLRDPDIAGGADEHGPYIRVAFELPRGSYATIVTREIIKPDAPGPLLDDDSGED